MNVETKAKLVVELVWWVFTIAIVGLVIWPVYKVFQVIPYLGDNILFIVAAITFSRYTFLLKQTFFVNSTPIKIFMIFLCLPLVLTVANRIHVLQVYLDQIGMSGFHDFVRPNVSHDTLRWGVLYFSQEYFFFGVTAVVAAVTFAGRMILSIWRAYNKEGI
jgi:hypothetical protein